MSFVKALIEKYSKEWKEYTKHPIGKQIAEGTLPRKDFINYLEQDALYLEVYGKCWDELSKMTNDNHLKKYCSEQAKIILEDELEINKYYSCKDVGQIIPSQETILYIDYMNDCAKKNDFDSLFFCLLSCFIGYAEFGKNISKYENRNDKYIKWIDIYCSNEFWENAKIIINIADSLSVKMSSKKKELMGEIFRKTLILERDFFSQGVVWKK